MPVTLKLEGLDQLERNMRSLPDLMEAGVEVIGSAVAYSLVWEWGSARIKKPGPKTMYSTNPLGEPAILTLTAPMGYIRVNREVYRQILKEEFSKLDLHAKPIKEWTPAIKKMLGEVARKCRNVIRDTAPIGDPPNGGWLRASILEVLPDDPLLKGTENEYGPTQLDVGQSWMEE